MKKEFNALPWDRAKVGICTDDLDRIGIEQGNWIDITYGGKKMSAIVRGVERKPQWKVSPIYIKESQAKKKLGIPSIRGHDATNPSAVNLGVSKRRFPPITATWPALATLALLLAGIIFKGIADGGETLGLEIPKLVKDTANLALVVLAVIGAITQAYEVYAKKQ